MKERYGTTTNSDCIQHAIANIVWNKACGNVDVRKLVMFFNETVFNFIRNFIPHETVTFDDKDPPRITSHIKKMINDKNLAFKRFVKRKDFVNNSGNLKRFSSPQNKLSSLIETLKREYFSIRYLGIKKTKVHFYVLRK